MDTNQGGPLHFEGWDKVLPLIQTDIVFIILPLVTPVFKQMVIQPATFFKLLTYGSYLVFSRHQPVIIGFKHISKLLSDGLYYRLKELVSQTYLVRPYPHCLCRET